jgi:pimeloyl-ACP methyl ester carboxylesterase
MWEQVGSHKTTSNSLARLSLQSLAQRARRMMMILLSILLTCVLVVVVVLLIWSYPGAPQPFVNKNGNLLPNSLSEKIFVNINGVNQGMFILSKDLAHPLLLYLHGGMPDYFLTQTYPTGLEDYFTVVWWEQRGSGLSYATDIPPETLTPEHFIADTLEVTNYLRQRFGKEKIYLMGHSGGTFIGVQAAAQAPELYYAYIGVAQMVNQRESEKLAYDYMLQQFRENGNLGMVRSLEAAPVTLTNGTPKAYLSLRDGAMHSLGVGTTHEMTSVIRGIFLASLRFREYTLLEKINLWRGKSQAGVSILWDAAMVTDLRNQVPKLEIPVYFFHGSYDYTVSCPLARDYLAKLKAPVKGFYTFRQSAHSPMFEEPEKTLQVLQEDVVAGMNRLADLTGEACRPLAREY